jgi:hypothetical protein
LAIWRSGWDFRVIMGSVLSAVPYPKGKSAELLITLHQAFVEPSTTCNNTSIADFHCEIRSQHLSL